MQSNRKPDERRRKPTAQPAQPVQQPVTDEPAPRKPAVWKKPLKLVLSVVGILLALALVYVFLLLGEPDEDEQLTAQNAPVEERIQVPMAAVESSDGNDLGTIAANFGKPILTCSRDGLTLSRVSLYDTAFQGAYARRVTLTYAFDDGTTCTVDSIRPKAAVTLLGGDYSLDASSLYTIAGMDAVKQQSRGGQSRILAQGVEAVYAITCPSGHEDDLTALLKQASLMQTVTPQ